MVVKNRTLVRTHVADQARDALEESHNIHMQHTYQRDLKDVPTGARVRVHQVLFVPIEVLKLDLLMKDRHLGREILPISRGTNSLLSDGRSRRLEKFQLERCHGVQRMCARKFALGPQSTVTNERGFQ